MSLYYVCVCVLSILSNRQTDGQTDSHRSWSSPSILLRRHDWRENCHFLLFISDEHLPQFPSSLTSYVCNVEGIGSVHFSHNTQWMNDISEGVKFMAFSPDNKPNWIIDVTHTNIYYVLYFIGPKAIVGCSFVHSCVHLDLLGRHHSK